MSAVSAPHENAKFRFVSKKREHGKETHLRSRTAKFGYHFIPFHTILTPIERTRALANTRLVVNAGHSVIKIADVK